MVGGFSWLPVREERGPYAPVSGPEGQRVSPGGIFQYKRTRNILKIGIFNLRVLGDVHTEDKHFVVVGNLKS